MLEGPLGRVPVALQRVHADLTCERSDVGVKDFGEEVALWCALREPAIDDKFAAEDSTFVRRGLCVTIKSRKIGERSREQVRLPRDFRR